MSSASTTINWGDGSSSSGATLTTDSHGNVQVWAGHAYAALQNYHITVNASAGMSAATFHKTAQVHLNAQRGLTISEPAGAQFIATVAEVDRPRMLPILTSPASSLPLAGGTQFAQFTVPGDGATATVTVDWGDGTVSPGIFSSASRGSYVVQASHTYSSAGSYRVISYVVITDASNTVLHVDMIDSTAHVAVSPSSPHVQFSLPQHTQVDSSAILPAGAHYPTPGTSTTSGSTGATTTAGNVGTSSGGILSVSGGTLGEGIYT